MLLVVAAASVLLGTLYPLALDALGLGKISVGPPYFETVFVPLMAPALFLMGVGPIARWKSASLPELAVRLRWAALVSVIVAIVLPFTLGRWSWGVSAGLLAAAWIAASSRHGLLAPREERGRQLAGRETAGILTELLRHAVRAPRRRGIRGRRDAGERLCHGERRAHGTGDTVELAGYTFRFVGVTDVEGPNYVAARARSKSGAMMAPVAVMHPEKRIYNVQQHADDRGRDRSRFHA